MLYSFLGKSLLPHHNGVDFDLGGDLRSVVGSYDGLDGVWWLGGWFGLVVSGLMFFSRSLSPPLALTLALALSVSRS